MYELVCEENNMLSYNGMIIWFLICIILQPRDLLRGLTIFIH